ncbi:MAG: hypothetical protein P4L46_22660 [Fimbriimonas sp.]|nr:hypothetical protein [Fimbriimonas sp.]
MIAALALAIAHFASPRSTHSDGVTNRNLIAIEDDSHDLRLILDCDRRCAVTSVVVRDQEVGSPGQSAFSGIKVGSKWYTTLDGIATPTVLVDPKRIVVSGIRFGSGSIQVEEKWTFRPGPNEIEWQIDRRYLSSGSISASRCPGWLFGKMSTWTGALLSTGGVAWCKLFDTPRATYGVHADSASLWNRADDLSLTVTSKSPCPANTAMTFTRQSDGAFGMAFSPSDSAWTTLHGQTRFLRDREDIWAPQAVKAGEACRANYVIRPASYHEANPSPRIGNLDTNAVVDILHTIGRIGVIDDKIVGSNGWYSGYAVLHEPWFALMGLAIDDPLYTQNLARSLDYQRDHAVMPDGMVKSRWAYGSGDAQPGTYDPTGFYECQWGRLMDTQPSYVINVSELFDLNGDLSWVRGQKRACESALDYLLNHDSNANHLVEMAVDSHAAHKSSDWLDVIWASYENAYVNAQLYRALRLWADIEGLLGDAERARAYANDASLLKISFNKPTSEGGFWDAKNRWYVYWREKDGSTYGDNLTLPVNLMAIAFGICDRSDRRQAILDLTEKKMTEQHLLCWPVNIFPFRPEETANQHFPEYENGDMFLAWAETGIRAYAAYRPEVALKYVRQVLEQYRKDGLAFQRYLRATGKGEGDDILANNCSAVVGLFRDILGIQPKYNRLMLSPRLTEDFKSAELSYTLRNRTMRLSLSPNHYTVSSAGMSVEATHDFGVSFRDYALDYYDRDRAAPSLSVDLRRPARVAVGIRRWASQFEWTLRLTGRRQSIQMRVSGLNPGAHYRLTVDGLSHGLPQVDRRGSLSFAIWISGDRIHQLDLGLAASS